MNKQQLLEELKREGFSELILKAFETVEREKFIPKEFRQWAYENNALPTVGSSTISQPYTIAFMLDLLELDKLINNTKLVINKINKDYESDNINMTDKGEKVNKQEQLRHKGFNITNKNKTIKILEIGSGSGYVIALIEEMLRQLSIKNYRIIGLEIIDELVEKSREIFQNNKQITIIKKNGSQGLKEKAPFDRIIASASFEKIPEHLFEQLNNNGLFVCPIKNSIFQFKKINKKIESKEYEGFVFVSMEE